MIIEYILMPFYLMLPAYFANMAPVFFQNTLKFMAVPVDFGRKWDGKPIFGANKTFRGFFVGTLMGIAISFLQYLLQRANAFSSLAYLDYSNFLLVGFLLGFGALFGDLTKSFFKRRLNIPPGRRFMPFDQLDFVIGALAFLSLYQPVPIKTVLPALVISFFLHINANRIGFLLKIRSQKW